MNEKKPFYKRGVFWVILVVTIAVLAFIIMGIIAHIGIQKSYEDAIDKVMYGNGGTKITDIADEFEDHMESYYK